MDRYRQTERRTYLSIHRQVDKQATHWQSQTSGWQTDGQTQSAHVSETLRSVSMFPRYDTSRELKGFKRSWLGSRGYQSSTIKPSWDEKEHWLLPHFSLISFFFKPHFSTYFLACTPFYPHFSQIFYFHPIWTWFFSLFSHFLLILENFFLYFSPHSFQPNMNFFPRMRYPSVSHTHTQKKSMQESSLKSQTVKCMQFFLEPGAYFDKCCKP